MNTNSNSGHAINVANLSKINQLISGLGAAYNPANSKIGASELKKLQLSAEAKLLDVNTELTNWKIATNLRETAFKNLDAYVKSLQDLLNSLGVSPQTISDMKTLVRRLEGSGKLTKADAGKNGATPASSDAAATTPAPTTLSTSHRSFDERIDSLTQIVLLLQNEPKYNANEVAFSKEGLQNKLNEMKVVNDAANEAKVALTNARIARNSFLYDPKNGALALVKQTKAYIKGLKGRQSADYAAAKAIRFTRIITKL